MTFLGRRRRASSTIARHFSMNPVRRNPNRPKVPDLVPLIAAVYANHGAGCCLHVVTDDGNWECAEFVLGYAREQGHPACIAAAEMMVQMTESQISRATERAMYGGRKADAEPLTNSLIVLPFE